MKMVSDISQVLNSWLTWPYNWLASPHACQRWTPPTLAVKICAGVSLRDCGLLWVRLGCGNHARHLLVHITSGHRPLYHCSPSPLTLSCHSHWFHRSCAYPPPHSCSQCSSTATHGVGGPPTPSPHQQRASSEGFGYQKEPAHQAWAAYYRRRAFASLMAKVWGTTLITWLSALDCTLMRGAATAKISWSLSCKLGAEGPHMAVTTRPTKRRLAWVRALQEARLGHNWA